MTAPRSSSNPLSGRVTGGVLLGAVLLGIGAAFAIVLLTRGHHGPPPLRATVTLSSPIGTGDAAVGPSSCFGFLSGGPVTVCSPSLLATVNREHREEEQPTVGLAFDGTNPSVGGNSAVVQSLGDPMTPGDSVTVTGSAPDDSAVFVRATGSDHRGYLEAVYTHLHLRQGGKLVIHVSGDGGSLTVAAKLNATSVDPYAVFSSDR